MKRKASIVTIALVVASMILSACASNTAKTKVRIGTDATWPPFEQVNEQTKNIEGFDIDLMNAIAAKGGFEVEYVNVGFDPLLAGMAQCSYDAAISSITITDERKKTMLFSDPYINAGQIVVVRTDNTDIKSKDDLTGKTVGAQIGTTGAIEVQNMEGVTLRTYDTVDLAYLDLANGQIDAVVADYPTANAFVAKDADKIMSVGDVFTDEYYGVAICQKNADLQAKINEGLAAVKEEGLIEKLDAKWLKGESQ